MEQQEIFDADVAIVGMAGRFPGADDPDALWRNTVAGMDCVTRFSEDESRAAGAPEALLADPRHVRAAGALPGFERFDAAFFGMSAAEAVVTDPQHRLFLECAWEAMERAGYAPGEGAGVVGVFAGCGANHYGGWVRADPDAVRRVGGFGAALGTAVDALATRTSYKLDLRGPSVAVQTACSTSLVAVHLACQSLLANECDMALAGGVTVDLSPARGYLHEEGGILAPDGRCRAFDADAAGTVGGSGVGVVALKRLAAALADGDPVLAVIRGTAVNNDGAAKVGFTAPGVDGQTRVISEALAVAGVDPATIGYVEAHGTGTALGDPVEMAALTAAFRAGTDQAGFCAVGALKTSVGHLDAAAGVAGLIRAVQALRHRTLPPVAHFRAPTPRIPWQGSPFYVSDRARPWAPRGGVLRAGVSSFGIGGTNAHAIVEAAPAATPSEPDLRPQLVVLSARTPAALDEARARLAAHLRAQPAVSLADAAFTLQAGRRAWEHRLAAVCRDADDAARVLEGAEPERLRAGASPSGGATAAFLFPGQGAQYPGMGAQLYRQEPVFRAEVDRCAALLLPHLGLDLRAVLHPADPASPAAAAALARTALAQPALFTVEYALARLWMHRGVHPDAMLGHSVGEYVAACLAGVFSLDAALRLVAARGRLMEACAPGAMLSVALDEGAAAARLGTRLSLAAVNAPGACVVSGPTDDVEALEAALQAEGIGARRLHTSHAFHSAAMDPALPAFRDEVRRAAPRAPSIPFVSNLTGTWITPGQAQSPEYWAEHLRGTVRFADGVGALLAEPRRVLLEVGPGTGLSGLARRHGAWSAERTAAASLRHPGEDTPDGEQVLRALGALWTAGTPVAWDALHEGRRRQRVILPTYPWQRRPYLAARPGASAPPAPPAGRDADPGRWFYVPSWRRAPLPPAPADARRWLVLADAAGVGREVAARFESSGDAVAGVWTAADAVDGDALAARVRALRESGAAPTDVAYLWALDGAAGDDADDAARSGAAQRAFHGMLRLADALGEGGAPVRLAVVSAGVHEVTAAEPLRPEFATLAGACRVIPQEYASLAVRAVDVVLPADAGQLAAELRCAADAPVTALRGPYRWVQGWAPQPLAPPTGMAPLRAGGVYLVTGGLGMIGLAVAEHLATAVGARLVLTSRRGLPPREGWDAWLAEHGGDDAAGHAIRAVRRMEAAGAEVVVAAADVADAGAMRAVVHAAVSRWGQVHGAFHAAGVSGADVLCAVRDTDAEQAAPHLRAKVLGTYALREALAGTAPDFRVLFSSLSTVLGGVGFAAYAGANAFMDAFAHLYRREGEPWVSVGWDGWLRGGATKAGRGGEFALGLDEGVDALRRILAAPGAPHVVLSTGSLEARMRPVARRAPPPAEDAGDEDAAGPAHARTPYAAPTNEIEELVAAVWQDQLAVDRVGIHDDFFELGGHSLLGLRIVARLRADLEVDVGMDVLFRAPTVARFSAEIMRRLLAEMEAMDDEAAERLALEIET